MRVAITGSSGLIGSALAQALAERRHNVIRLVRRRPRDDSEGQWDPATGIVDEDILAGLDALVHLAGAGIATGRWSARRKAEIHDSRINGTRQLISGLAQLDAPPRRFLCGSAIGYYGSRGAERLDETSDAGEGFLADLCQAWESEARAASGFAERVYFLRTGIVLSTDGGALAKMLPPFKLGLGGIIGPGEQYMSWIALDDEVGAIIHLIEADLDSSLTSGPVNLTAPSPVTNRDFTRALGQALHRPTVFPLPTFVVKTLFGEMGEEALLGSQRVLPRRLEASGYRFANADLDSALQRVL